MKPAKGGAVLMEITPLERANEPIGLSDVSRETGYSYYHIHGCFLPY